MERKVPLVFWFLYYMLSVKNERLFIKSRKGISLQEEQQKFFYREKKRNKKDEIKQMGLSFFFTSRLY